MKMMSHTVIVDFGCGQLTQPKRDGLRQAELCPRYTINGSILKSGQGWTLAAEDRTRWEGAVEKSSVVPQRPFKVLGRLD